MGREEDGLQQKKDFCHLDDGGEVFGGDFMPCGRERDAVAGIVKGAGACETTSLDCTPNSWPWSHMGGHFIIPWWGLYLWRVVFWNEEVEDAEGDVLAIGIAFVRVAVSRRASDDDFLGYVIYFGGALLFALVYEAGDQY